MLLQKPAYMYDRHDINISILKITVIVNIGEKNLMHII